MLRLYLNIEAKVNGEIVYSDVVSMVFDGTGTKSVVIKELPAGANNNGNRSLQWFKL